MAASSWKARGLTGIPKKIEINCVIWMLYSKNHITDSGLTNCFSLIFVGEVNVFRFSSDKGHYGPWSDCSDSWEYILNFYYFNFISHAFLFLWQKTYKIYYFHHLSGIKYIAGQPSLQFFHLPKLKLRTHWPLAPQSPFIHLLATTIFL